MSHKWVTSFCLSQGGIFFVVAAIVLLRHSDLKKLFIIVFQAYSVPICNWNTSYSNPTTSVPLPPPMLPSSLQKPQPAFLAGRFLSIIIVAWVSYLQYLLLALWPRHIYIPYLFTASMLEAPASCLCCCPSALHPFIYFLPFTYLLKLGSRVI